MNIAKYIDHTILKPEATVEDVKKLCKEAREYNFASVCVNGCFAKLVSTELNGSVAGLGFLALAALIFGQWKPLGILAATAFFGFATTMANVSQVIPALGSIPLVVLKIFPYVATLIALVLFSKSSRAPKAEGEPFDSGKR